MGFRNLNLNAINEQLSQQPEQSPLIAILGQLLPMVAAAASRGSAPQSLPAAQPVASVTPTPQPPPIKSAVQTMGGMLNGVVLPAANNEVIQPIRAVVPQMPAIKPHTQAGKTCIVVNNKKV